MVLIWGVALDVWEPVSPGLVLEVALDVWEPVSPGLVFYTVFIQCNSVFIPLWSAIPILVGFLLVLHSGFLFQEVLL
jgi:hypothetical protein